MLYLLTVLLPVRLAIAILEICSCFYDEKNVLLVLCQKALTVCEIYNMKKAVLKPVVITMEKGDSGARNPQNKPDKREQKVLEKFESSA